MPYNPSMSEEPTNVAPEQPRQEEMPFAVVQGQAVTELPKDLYIPPDALEVFLESFEGPLDLLLYFIRRQNLDILEIDVSKITDQYVQYIEAMQAMRFELAAEYLVMAALLAEIKSRMLLPRQQEEEGEEGDPRAELILRLQEYERFKEAAEDIDKIPRDGRDVFPAEIELPELPKKIPHPEVDLRELLMAFSEVMHRANMYRSHTVSLEPLSTRERMAMVLDEIQSGKIVEFVSLFTVEEGRMGVAVTFLAILELIKESLIEVTQGEEFGMIHVKARESSLERA
jgi:segregation and condensation protein A